MTLAEPAGSHPASLIPATARKPPFHLLLAKWVKFPQAKINQQWGLKWVPGSKPDDTIQHNKVPWALANGQPYVLQLQTFMPPAQEGNEQQRGESLANTPPHPCGQHSATWPCSVYREAACTDLGLWETSGQSWHLTNPARCLIHWWEKDLRDEPSTPWRRWQGRPPAQLTIAEKPLPRPSCQPAIFAQKPFMKFYLIGL